MDVLPIWNGSRLWTFAEKQTPFGNFADELDKESAHGSLKAESANPPKLGASKAAGADDDAPAPTAEALATFEEPRMSGALATNVQSTSEVSTAEHVLSMRVFGLHLQASRYLSECTLSATGHVRPSADAREGMNVEASASDEFAMGATMAEPALPAMAQEDSGTFVEGTSLVQASPDTADERPDVARLLSCAGNWTDVRWQSRSLRLFSRDNGKHVAWLRDYTLSVEDARRLAVDLARQLSREGVSLQSIIWNGHEIWSSNPIGQGK